LHNNISPKAAVLKTKKVLFCRKCGTKLLDDSDFCHKCGLRIIKENIK